jgi:hypothetical protein
VHQLVEEQRAQLGARSRRRRDVDLAVEEADGREREAARVDVAVGRAAVEHDARGLRGREAESRRGVAARFGEMRQHRLREARRGFRQVGVDTQAERAGVELEGAQRRARRMGGGQAVLGLERLEAAARGLAPARVGVAGIREERAQMLFRRAVSAALALELRQVPVRLGVARRVGEHRLEGELGAPGLAAREIVRGVAQQPREPIVAAAGRARLGRERGTGDASSPEAAARGLGHEGRAVGHARRVVRDVGRAALVDPHEGVGSGDAGAEAEHRERSRKRRSVRRGARRRRGHPGLDRRRVSAA